MQQSIATCAVPAAFLLCQNFDVAPPIRWHVETGGAYLYRLCKNERDGISFAN